MIKTNLTLMVLGLIIFFNTGCAAARAEALPYVDLSQREALPAAAPAEIVPLRLAVAAIISPEGTAESYGGLAVYLGERLGRPVELIQRRTYAEANTLIEQGEVDLAFVCTSAYVAGRDAFGMELLVAPEVNGEHIYYSVLIVQRPVYEADNPPLSRRGFFGVLKQLGTEVAVSKERAELLKTGKMTPVSERPPQFVPEQRHKVLAILKQNPWRVDIPSPASDAQSSTVMPTLPLVDVSIDPISCTACSLCARFCPTKALKFLSDGQIFALTFQPSLCLGESCNICQIACPEQAIITQPLAISPDILTKKPLGAGELAPCQRCRQPIAQGPDLPVTCFACRQTTPLNDLFKSLPTHCH